MNLIPLFVPSTSPSATFNKICSDFNELSELFLSSPSLLSRSEKKAFRRTLVKRSPSVDLSFNCSGSTRNFLSPKITPPAVTPAFTPDDYQDDSPDMALDPAIQSVLRDPAFQRICSTGPNRYTYGSDGEIDECLLPDYPVQPFPTICNNISSNSAHSLQSFAYDDEDGLSTYVPSELIGVSQLMSDTGLPFAAATRLVNKLPGLYAHAKAMYASPPDVTLRQVDSFIDFDDLLCVYDAPLQQVESFIISKF
ncbi:unnamed protein product [Rhizophagus irregularis]|nr:unnamed protein product [Rhizophagus irregularis]